MVVGRGMVAEAFRSYRSSPTVKIFASGVSNSGETRASEFRREQELLYSHLSGFSGCLVYFSTCSILYAPEDSPYVRHKIAIEEEISRLAQNFMIFRVPQLVGRSSNPMTLTNYIHDKITRGEPFRVYARATRSLLDIDDAYSLCSHLIASHAAPRLSMDVALPYTISVLDLVKAFEKVLGQGANYEIVEGGERFRCRDHNTAGVGRTLGLVFDEGYVERLLEKYYGEQPTAPAQNVFTAPGE